MGERPKMFAPSDVHYFFRKIFYLLPKFSDVKTFFFFFCSPSWFFRFSGGFPGNFCPKIGENGPKIGENDPKIGENDPKWEKMTLSTFGKKPQNGRKPTPKWEKAYPKMGENSVKIFKSRGGVLSYWKFVMLFL